MNCPFCEQGIGWQAFLSSENFLVIYNRSPILPGHSLIIPKAHYISLLDLPRSVASEMMGLSVHAARWLMQVFHAAGFDWTIQDGEAAGQTVGHLHLHLIPRKANDLPDPGDWYKAMEQPEYGPIDSVMRPRFSEAQLIEIAQRIKNSIPERERLYRE